MLFGYIVLCKKINFLEKFFFVKIKNYFFRFDFDNLRDLNKIFNIVEVILLKVLINF